MPPHVEHIEPGPLRHGRRADPRNRQDRENRGEQDHEQHARPEHGRRIADDRADGDELRQRSLRLARGQHPERGADEHRYDQRCHQKQDRRRQPFEDQRRHRQVEEVGVAEIAAQDPADVDHELLRDRQIEPIGLAQLGADLLGHAAHLTGERFGRITRR